MNLRPLKDSRHWIFDMDGTLTVAQHDFDAIRQELDLPPDQPILEALAGLPETEADARMRKLDAIELQIAATAQSQEGVVELLERLQAKRVNTGIVTRNNLPSTLLTLTVCGLTDFFTDKDIVSRGCALPKPNPDGVFTLLNRWQGLTDHTVMVGDYLFDMQCGRGAGVTTVYFDPDSENRWNQYADIVVGSLKELSGYL